MAITPTVPGIQRSIIVSGGTLPESPRQIIDPRESMIQSLTEQNESLLDTFEKATLVFQQNQAQQKQTISTLAKSNEQLQAALIASEGRIKEMDLVHQAEMKSLKDMMKKLSEENIALKQFKAKAKPRLAAIATHYSEFKPRKEANADIWMFGEMGEAQLMCVVSMSGLSAARAQECQIGISHEKEMLREIKEAAEEFKKGEFQ